ncbi:cell wall elongation regulator TseB-like domain-containing protein [Cohnella mopanensis]|uniref:cell wall elongation regulator TseB-like domain-containing protein n=1 Tax=Cohnella mopanensis TaxID=2911966 RepID=UPI001EF9281B|nr:DUF5590 domain-containing protein [Cohnella mopanensis]
MNLSRSEGQRKIPSLSLGRWIVILAGFILFVIVSIVLFVRSADSEYRNGENRAIRIAKEQGGLVEISKSSPHTWDETVWIVTGNDSAGETWMVWERKDELIRKKVSENVSEKQMLAKFSQEHSGDPIRIIPGWFMDQPAWEIRYWSEKSKQYQSLDFYSFEDGRVLKTYVLSSQ